MEPEIREREAFTVMGVLLRINPMTADYHDIWSKLFGARESDIRPFVSEDAAYGLYSCATADADGVIEFVAGLPVGSVSEVPDGLVVREVPDHLEAVFECSIATLGQTWHRIFGEWLPGSGYDHDDGPTPCYERFPPGCHEGAAPVTIHVALRPRG